MIELKYASEISTYVLVSGAVQTRFLPLLSNMLLRTAATERRLVGLPVPLHRLADFQSLDEGFESLEIRAKGAFEDNDSSDSDKDQEEDDEHDVEYETEGQPS